MKFSFNKKSKLDETITITIPSKEIEEKIEKQLLQTQRDSKIKGYRKGKAPYKVVKKLYEGEIRGDVINDTVSHSFYHLVEEKGLKPVGPPKMTPKSLVTGKDVKFEATFDVYPEVKLSNLTNINFVKPLCELKEKDVNDSISNLQKRLSSWNLKEGSSAIGDQVKINFTGFVDDKEFEGNSAKDFTLELGSNSMIPGFEDGILGKNKEDTFEINLNFPDDYHAKDMASKEAKFKIEVLEVLESSPPEMNEEFFKTVGIEAKDEKTFRDEIKKRLEEDLKKALSNKTKSRIFEGLLDANPFELPESMIENEIDNMRKESARRMGIEPDKIKIEDFPGDLFKEEATKRVKLGVLLNGLVEELQLKADPDKVKKLIEERASTYQDPQQVINWFYSNDEQLKQIEFLSLEEQASESILAKAKSSEEHLSYEECIKSN